MKTICTICARGGSQGVKNKNILSVKGKPLIAHSILQAKQSGMFDVIAVSSDSEKIRTVAKKWGADYVINRPQELSSSTAAKLPAIQHAVREIEQLTSQSFDIMVDLDATSPLREVNDIVEAVNLLVKHRNASNLITAFPSRRSPYFNMVEVNESGYVNLAKLTAKLIVRRQDVPLCYDMNASIYVWKRDAFFEEKPVITIELFYTLCQKNALLILIQSWIYNGYAY